MSDKDTNLYFYNPPIVLPILYTRNEGYHYTIQGFNARSGTFCRVALSLQQYQCYPKSLIAEFIYLSSNF